MPLKKSWRWTGAFTPNLMLCVATAKVGPIKRSWWAVWDGATLHQGHQGALHAGGHRTRHTRSRPRPARHGRERRHYESPAPCFGGRSTQPGLLDESSRSASHAAHTGWWSARSRPGRSTAGGVALELRRRECTPANGGTRGDGSRACRTRSIRRPFDGLPGVWPISAFTHTRHQGETRELSGDRLGLRTALRHVRRRASPSPVSSLPAAGVMERHEALW